WRKCTSLRYVPVTAPAEVPQQATRCRHSTPKRGDRSLPVRSLDPALVSPEAWPAALVLGLVHQGAGLDPGHHGAEALADFLDRMLIGKPTGCLEAGSASLVFLHPLGSEPARLDVLEDGPHLLASLVGD